MHLSLQSNLPHIRWRPLIFLASIILTLLIITGCSYPGSQPPPAPQVGRQAPDFTLTDLKGNQIKLSDLRGKVVFINFWATWCPPCRAEMPEIEAIYQEYKGKNVVFIGVDLFEPENVVREFIQRGGYSWTFVIDTTSEVTRNYKVTVIPTSFFLDKDGVIQAVKIGAMSQQTIKDKLAEAMKK